MESLAGIRPIRLDMVDARAWRAVMKIIEELPQRRLVTFGDDPHRPIALISHPPAKSQTARNHLRRLPKKDALHQAADGRFQSRSWVGILQ